MKNIDLKIMFKENVTLQELSNFSIINGMPVIISKGVPYVQLIKVEWIGEESKTK